MQTSVYLTHSSEDGVFNFRSQALLYKLLGIHERFGACIAYAPYAKYAPNCSRPLNRSNQQKRPRLLADLMEAKIPSSRARLLLREISHCVVCGVTGWHQPESEKIFKEWCQKLWRSYLRAHGLDPELCLSSPDKMNRREWFAALETAKSEHEAQLALLAGSWDEESESGSEEETELSSDDGDSCDDSGSDDGDSDDGDSDDSSEELVILTPGSTASDLAHGDVLPSNSPSSLVDKFSFREEHSSAPTAVSNKKSRRPTSSGRNSPASHSSHQIVETVVSVTQRKSGLQKSSARLQVYRDPQTPPALPTQSCPNPARVDDSTTASTTASPPTGTRPRALGALDRNMGFSNQERATKPQSGPSHPRASATVHKTSRPRESAPTAVHIRASDGNPQTHSTQTETMQQSDSQVDGRLVRNDNTSRNNDRRPCSRCRGTGYRVLDSGPLATEDDMLQMLSQYDVTEDDEPALPDISSSPTSKGFRLYPQLNPEDNRKSILNTILQHSGPRNRAPGYIYAFTRPSLPGFIKIGYTSAVEQPDRPYPHPVDFRLARWASDCGYPVKEVFREYMPCAAKRMESLIHQTLREYRRIQDPVCRPCRRRGGGRGGAHDEWFEVDIDEARQAVRAWAVFSEQRPYDSFGALIEFWAEKAEQERGAKNGLSLVQWLERIPCYVEELRRLEFRTIVGFVRGLRS